MAKKVARKASKAALGGSVENLLGKGKKTGTDALFGSTNIPKVVANSIAKVPINQIEANLSLIHI